MAAADKTRRLGAFSRGILRAQRGRRILALSGWELVDARRHRDLDAIAGWAYRPSAERARRVAAERGLPYVALEDGFLRSLTLGLGGEPPLSLLIDPVGVHYAADAPSALEQMLASNGWESAELMQRARDGIAFLRRHRLSKYNAAPDSAPDLPEPGFILVVDQTFGDASITHGGASADTFRTMLQAARDENPGAPIVVKTHPDVLTGKKRGHFSAADLAGVTLCTQDVSPWALIERAARVYVVTSQMGFEALMAGKPVRVFGAPFYAGWGVSEDAQSLPRRQGERSIEALFAAAYLRFPVYYDPLTDQLCDFETVASALALRRRINEANRQPSHCLGVTLWKRQVARDFLGSTAGAPRFHQRAEKAIEAARADGGRVVAWSARVGDALKAQCAAARVPLAQLEDGFLRSVGLGQQLRLPASLCLDASGIYYDPRQSSDLETLIERGDLPSDLLARAADLRARIIKGRVSKYVLPQAQEPLDLPAGRRIVLVIGQVEDDASIRTGTTEIRTNADLLRAAHAARGAEDYLIYKPHPDVETGHRQGAIGEAAALADLIARETSAPALLARADAVWTMTSLMGFEALLHGKPVTCAGWPFYAGWGLTEDIAPPPDGLRARRTRAATLEEVLAAAYLLYPRYRDPRTGLICTAETVLDRLAEKDPKLGRHPSPVIRTAAGLRNLWASWTRKI
ncbi:MAG: capsular polysaccharide biosynthesis protein [Neomegalonema sp.]|nr:capsular polysaccharide biosynthesis protein [Neomegalonema sp.]